MLKLLRIDKLLCGALLVLPVAFLLWVTVPRMAFSPRVVTADITGLLREYVRIQAPRNVPAAELSAHTLAYGQRLETILQALAKERHLVILPKEAVIAGAVDITPLIREELKLRDIKESEREKKANEAENAVAHDPQTKHLGLGLW